MNHPKIAPHEKILGKACVVEVLGLGYFRTVSELGRGDLICCHPGQQVCAGDIGWVISAPGPFYGSLRFVQDASLLFDFDQAQELYSHKWRDTWPGYVPSAKKKATLQEDVSQENLASESVPSPSVDESFI